MIYWFLGIPAIIYIIAVLYSPSVEFPGNDWEDRICSINFGAGWWTNWSWYSPSPYLVILFWKFVIPVWSVYLICDAIKVKANVDKDNAE